MDRCTRLALLIGLVGCGARTPLEGSEHRATDAAIDAGTDGAPERPDAAELPDVLELDASCSMCTDEQNSGGPPDESCNHGSVWLSWEWLPACDMVVSAIELHTRSGGTVALFPDDGGRPGPPLSTGTLGDPDPEGWRRGQLRDVRVTGGRRYWIGEQTMDCSLSAAGTPQPYFGGNSLRGPWDGPFEDPGRIWTSKIEGVCDL